ncbi:MAG: polysaccharide biosynthesis protein [Phycisphaeraceae bacterium]|nr:polysaccharide biosynthesis protein [Phycisphaeraceae bacterium]
MLDAPARPTPSAPETLPPPWFLGERVVLVGTAATLGDLQARLARIPAGVRPVATLELSGDPAPLLRRIAALDDESPISTAILSLPRTLQAQQTRVRAMLSQRGIRQRLIPPLLDLLLEEPPPPTAHAALAPRFDLGALIDRQGYDIDRAGVAGLITGRRVLVTGAGGSIGSEIVRIVAAFDPSLLVLMERSENALFEIDRQLARAFPDVPRRAMLHDVVDADATLRRVVEARPDVVFHAAAHKHVPLMEDHPGLAVENNLFGTKSIADAAVAVGASRFVLISSDKAVNPTSVMGATKRMAEMYVQGLHASVSDGARAGSTRLAMVRFGNVLGSAGSVVPIWSAQLAEGGPITVTDARMTRYFMTIHEAATLVIQAAAMIDDAEPVAPVFVLDMGEPIRILDMAERFVRLHGHQPRIVETNRPATADPAPLSTQHPALSTPIDIVLTGARPGEKIHEELAYSQEQTRATAHPGINAWIGAGNRLAPAAVTAMIAEMSACRSGADPAAVLAAIRRHVPEMQRPEQAAPPEACRRTG